MHKDSQYFLSDYVTEMYDRGPTISQILTAHGHRISTTIFSGKSDDKTCVEKRHYCIQNEDAFDIVGEAAVEAEAVFV